MSVRKVMVGELTGAALDWAVARCEVGKETARIRITPCGIVMLHDGGNPCGGGLIANFSTDWSCGGPIIEREKISLCCPTGSHWVAWDARISGGDKQFGPTPLVAAMRFYVARKLGAEVEVPAALLD